MTLVSRLDASLLIDHTSQALWWSILTRAMAGYRVLSELSVIQNHSGANMSVDVVDGTCLLAWVNTTVTGSGGYTNKAIDAAHATYGRFDLIYINSSGAPTVLKGTAAAISPSGATDYKKMVTPQIPSLAGTEGIPLAVVYVGPSATSITTANIWMIAAPGSGNRFEIDFPFGDGSAVLTAGQAEFCCPDAAKITRVDVWEVGLVSSSITCTLYKHAIGAAKGDAVDTFAISSDTDMTETGLSIAVAAHDVLRVETSGITAAKQIVCRLFMEAL